MNREGPINYAERVRDRLRGVTDPGTNMDVMAMGLIRNLDVTAGGAVSLEFRPSSSQCPLVMPLAFRIKEAVEDVKGVTGVTVTVTGHRMADQVTAMLNEKDDDS